MPVHDEFRTRAAGSTAPGPISAKHEPRAPALESANDSASNGKNRSADPRSVKWGSKNIITMIATRYENADLAATPTASVLSRATHCNVLSDTIAKKTKAATKGMPP